jgi:hypothetical protein
VNDKSFELAVARVMRELVISEVERDAFAEVLRSLVNEGADHAARRMLKAWPEGARWPAGELAVPPDEEGEVDMHELMVLLHWRVSHVAHRQFRDRQIRELLAGQPSHKWWIVINRGLDYREIPCGRPQAQVVEVTDGLRLMAQTPCDHAGCCCTFDPLSARDLARLNSV